MGHDKPGIVKLDAKDFVLRNSIRNFLVKRGSILEAAGIPYEWHPESRSRQALDIETTPHSRETRYQKFSRNRALKIWDSIEVWGKNLPRIEETRRSNSRTRSKRLVKTGFCEVSSPEISDGTCKNKFEIKYKSLEKHLSFRWKRQVET